MKLPGSPAAERKRRQDNFSGCWECLSPRGSAIQGCPRTGAGPRHPRSLQSVRGASSGAGSAPAAAAAGQQAGRTGLRLVRLRAAGRTLRGTLQPAAGRARTALARNRAPRACRLPWLAWTTSQPSAWCPYPPARCCTSAQRTPRARKPQLSPRWVRCHGSRRGRVPEHGGCCGSPRSSRSPPLALTRAMEPPTCWLPALWRI